MALEMNINALDRWNESIREFSEPLFLTRTRKLAVFIVILYILIAIIGPYIPLLPGPHETVTTPSGDFAKLQPPNPHHPLGTTHLSYSVLAQSIHSFRISIFIAVSSAAVILFIGMNLGLISGYYGGRIDSLIMAVTDFMYGLPLYPFTIVVLALFGQGTLNIIFIIGFTLWRTLARVTRSETLKIKEQEFVKSAKAVGSSNVKIMYYHILPNLLPVLLLYFVFGVSWSIILEASLSFLGLGDPEAISWGKMLFDAFNSGMFSVAWYWVLPPAFLLSTFIASLFVIGRALEENIEIDSSDEGGFA